MSAQEDILKLNDKIWAQVGEEVANKNYFHGPMAKAVAESNGNRDMVQSLYIKFRRDELLRQVESKFQEEIAKQKANEEAKHKAQQKAKLSYLKPLVVGLLVSVVLIVLAVSGTFFVTKMMFSGEWQIEAKNVNKGS